MQRTLLFVLAVAATVIPLACGDDTSEGDCVSLCEEAQAGDCTSITGDCDAFCEALFSVEDRSGCAGERLEYHECLNDEGVCGGACSGEESGLSTCVGAYCFGHGDEEDCQVLLASF